MIVAVYYDLRMVCNIYLIPNIYDNFSFDLIKIMFSLFENSLLHTSLIEDFVDVNNVTAYEPMTETPLHLSTNKRMKLIIIGLHTSSRVNENRSILKPPFLHL